MKKLISGLCAIVASFVLTVVDGGAVEVGQKAPGFDLPSTKGGKLSLASFLGKKNVLIEFYVLDFTPT